MKFYETIRAAAAVTAVIAATACSSAFERPEIELESVGIGALGLSGGTLNVNLSVDNPNAFGFRSDRIEYELFIRRADARSGDSAWVRLAEGIHEDDLEFPARRKQTVTIPVSFTYAALGEARRSLLSSGSFQYRALGTVDARASFGSRRVPFRKTGTFTIGGLGR